ncbi:hypothetical protein SDC9_168242 [bioreactor metagenome]|uniref:Uncharacterized protein n=1 Tax=bioreactor metagenome TaxID=1076179 RepID=A0A645GAF2_9ZZZZ
MRAVDDARAARANEDVFRVIGHADDLVRNDLSQRKNQVVGLVHNDPVDLNRNRRRPEPVRVAGNLLARQLANVDHVRTPTVL